MTRIRLRGRRARVADSMPLWRLVLTSYVQGGIKQKSKRMSYSVESLSSQGGHTVFRNSTLRCVILRILNSTRISPFPRVSLRHEQVAQVGVVSAWCSFWPLALGLWGKSAGRHDRYSLVLSRHEFEALLVLAVLVCLVWYPG